MSIYCTMWELAFPLNNWLSDDEKPIAVRAQGVPPHIDYVGEAWDWLPPPIDADSKKWRAVFFCTEWTQKATARCGQEYVNPLLMLTGDEYETIPFADLLERIEQAVAIQHEMFCSQGGDCDHSNGWLDGIKEVALT